jgi:hypothetical protein
VLVDRPTADAIAQNPGARKAALISLGRPVRPGDYLVLVAMHIATKEISDWVWATIWWHDQPEEGAFARARPDTVRGAWRNYLMDVAFDDALPQAADGGPHVSFNPWLEARFPDQGSGGGTVSNCMTCHRRASYPAIRFLPITRGQADLNRDPAYATDRLRTNFLWSIALQKPLPELDSQQGVRLPATATPP